MFVFVERIWLDREFHNQSGIFEPTTQPTTSTMTSMPVDQDSVMFQRNSVDLTKLIQRTEQRTSTRTKLARGEVRRVTDPAERRKTTSRANGREESQSNLNFDEVSSPSPVLSVSGDGQQSNPNQTKHQSINANNGNGSFMYPANTNRSSTATFITSSASASQEFEPTNVLADVVQRRKEEGMRATSKVAEGKSRETAWGVRGPGERCSQGGNYFCSVWLFLLF
jgi:hypothetical protein